MFDGRRAWQDWQIAKLLELLPENKSGSQIGVVVGKTRNAVIGQAHRMGLHLTGTHPRAGTGVRPRRTREPREPRIRIVRSKQRLSPSQPEPTPMLLEPLYIPLEDLKWPISECREIVTPDGVRGLFCGHPTYGKSSYCIHHHLVNETMPTPHKSASTPTPLGRG